MSINPPSVAVAFGSIAPPQGDIVNLRVHLGCTKEVGSFEAVLQNWNGKYSPNGAYPITVGLDGNISIGRAATCPQLMTCRVENLRYESTPTENYLRVSGRCRGERLFRRVVTKTYENKKGEEILKDLLDYYIGLSHVRDGVELVEYTDTTYTKLEYSDTPVMDILQEIASSADRQGIIGFDFRVAPDGKFEFFPKGTKTSTISLAEKIEASEYSKDVIRVRNRITVYGTSDKSVPTDKDQWTETLTPTDGTWTATAGTISLDTAMKTRGSASIKTYADQLIYAGCLLTLASGKEVNTNQYPQLNFALNQEASFNGNVTLSLYDTIDNEARKEFTLGNDKWFQNQFQVGQAYADQWQTQDGFNWQHVNRVQVICWFTDLGSGSFWVDSLFFGGKRFSSQQEDQVSQASFGLRELVEVNEEYCSDLECESHAKSLLSNLKDPSESLTIQSTLVDFVSTPILAGDKVHANLPNEGVNSDFRVLNVEYVVDAKTQTLETTLELGREKPLLADYVYALRSRTDRLSRVKKSK